MRIRIRKLKDGSRSVVFKSETSAEGVALKDAVVAAYKTGGLHPMRVVDELGKLGYEIESVGKPTRKKRGA